MRVKKPYLLMDKREKKAFVDKLKPRKRFDKNACAAHLIQVMDDSHNYVKAAFFTDQAHLTYWVKDPEAPLTKYTKTQIFFYGDDGMGPLMDDDITGLRDYVYAHMNLKDHHHVYDDPEYGNETREVPVPCILPGKEPNV